MCASVQSDSHLHFVSRGSKGPLCLPYTFTNTGSMVKGWRESLRCGEVKRKRGWRRDSGNSLD